jgi:hypothetical protein
MTAADDSRPRSINVALFGFVVSCVGIPTRFVKRWAHFAHRSTRIDDFSRQPGARFRGRRSSIMSRMRRNRSRGTATSAIWKAV